MDLGLARRPPPDPEDGRAAAPWTGGGRAGPWVAIGPALDGSRGGPKATPRPRGWPRGRPMDRG
jgi:hypothetical protein